VTHRAGCEFSRVQTLLTLAIMEAKSGAACGAVRKMRGTPGQRVGWNTHDPGMFCSCTPEMYEPLMCAFSPHVSRGYADQQNSQPVNRDNWYSLLGGCLATPL